MNMRLVTSQNLTRQNAQSKNLTVNERPHRRPGNMSLRERTPLRITVHAKHFYGIPASSISPRIVEERWGGGGAGIDSNREWKWPTVTRTKSHLGTNPWNLRRKAPNKPRKREEHVQEKKATESVRILMSLPRQRRNNGEIFPSERCREHKMQCPKRKEKGDRESVNVAVGAPSKQ